MIDEIKEDANQRMQKSVEALKTELAKLRTGRAHPSLLEHIHVNYYGTDTPLKHVANITVQDARTLAVIPWEKALTPTIEKAILTSDLGLNPTTSGETIRVPLPPLTEDRRKDLARLVKSEAESARVAVRNIRRDANSDFKDLLKGKDITEDELHQAEEAIQKLTDKYVANIDEIAGQKEEDLMSM